MKRLYGAKLRIIPRIEHGVRGTTEYVVIHDTESDNLDGVERYFSTSSPDAVGAHVGIGPGGETRQWADLDALVYHARGGNSLGVGIEVCGYASQPKWKWIKRARQRGAVAKAVARICHKYDLGIPSRHHNVKGHYEILAGGHSDPGPNFPWGKLMKRARGYYRRWYG